MKIAAKIIDLTDTQVDGQPACFVTLRLDGEKNPVTATLKADHLKNGDHRRLEAFLGKPNVLLDVRFMIGERGGIIWFFPPAKQGPISCTQYEPKVENKAAMFGKPASAAAV